MVNITINVYGCQDLFVKGPVSIVKDDVIVWHLLRAISRIYSLLLLLLSMHYKENSRIIFIAKKCAF